MRSLIVLERSLTPNTDKEKVMTEIRRLNWMQLWDDFRESVSTGNKTSWGKNEILRHIEEMERKMIRDLEKELD